MDGGTFKGILVYDSNSRSFVGVDDATNCANINVGTLVIIYARNVYHMVSFKYNAYIITGDNIISTPYRLARARYRNVLHGHLVFDAGSIDSMLGILCHYPTNITRGGSDVELFPFAALISPLVVQVQGQLRLEPCKLFLIEYLQVHH
jgi:hypothetical protein